MPIALVQLPLRIMPVENTKDTLTGIGVSVALSIILAIVGVVGFITATKVSVIGGAAIIFVSMILWSFTCINTDIAELTA